MPKNSEKSQKIRLLFYELQALRLDMQSIHTNNLIVWKFRMDFEATLAWLFSSCSVYLEF